MYVVDMQSIIYQHSSQPEVRMMLVSFAAMEAVHQEAYSLLLETLGKSDDMYQEFMDIQEMVEKHEYLTDFNMKQNMILQKLWQSIVVLQKEYNYLVVLLYY